jgi:hypothetical protein
VEERPREMLIEERIPVQREYQVVQEVAAPRESTILPFGGTKPGQFMA